VLKNRKQFIVNTGMQLKFTLVFVCIALAGCLFSVTIFNYLSIQKIESLLWSTHFSLQSTSEIIRPFFIFTNIVGFLFVALLLSLTGFWMLRKTEGPLLRISKDLMEMTDGNLSKKIMLRQKDEFRDIAVELNTMTGALRDRLVILRNKHGEILVQSEKINDLSDKDTADALLKNIGELRQEIQALSSGHTS
jgi:methyl-accepting chemotaxis protein